MKLIGIDYGSKRVGVAVSDADGSMAFPKAVVPNDRTLMSTIKELLKKEQVEAVVVGESKARDGSDNPIMQNARVFVGDLERETGLPIHFEPEFYSSAEAKRLKEQAGAQTGIVDAEAAAIILNSFIERQKSV